MLYSYNAFFICSTLFPSGISISTNSDQFSVISGMKGSFSMSLSSIFPTYIIGNASIIQRVSVEIAGVN